MRAEHTVEATPQRVGSRGGARAERPVTARIRAKPPDEPQPIEANLAPVPAVIEDVSPAEHEAVAEVISMPQQPRPTFAPITSYASHAKRSRKGGGNLAGQIPLFD